MTAYYEQVIEAAYLHSRPNCYFVGPYARRVSFASQQHRALDLVTALQLHGRLADKKIAVIGAGVAGVTATAALRALRHGLDLYESDSEPLTIQKSACHRVVHPSISRWPAENLELTTKFPLLDWPVGPCDRIIEALREQWDKYIKPERAEKDYNFFPKTTVKKIHCLEGKVGFEIEGEGQPPIYDLVIVTTGYGRELSVEGAEYFSYWTPDKVDEWRKSKRKVVVSGCGDGGLIDALRLIHGHFNDGRLALELASLLDGLSDTKKSINDAEANALLAAKSIKCIASAAPGALSDRQIGKAFEDDEIVGPLTTFYLDLAGKLPAAADLLLSESYRAAGCGGGQVTLASMQSKPFGPYAAPIHKLMVAHAMKRFFIIYKRAEVKAGPVMVGDDHKPVALTDVVVRHGAHSNLESLLEHEERESLKIRQFLLADYIDKDKKALDAIYDDAPKKIPTCPKSVEYIRSRHGMANFLVGWLKPGLTLSARDDGYHLDGGTFADCKLGAPTELFDIPVRAGDLPTHTFF